MLKFLFLLFITRQVLSTDEQTNSIPGHPLFTKILRLIDQLLLQVRKTQTLIICTSYMIHQIPSGIHPWFAECLTPEHNTSKIEYYLNLTEIALTRILEIQNQLKQAITLEQQLNTINITNIIIADVTFNVVKPSLSFVTEILDCFKSKYQTTLA